MCVWGRLMPATPGGLEGRAGVGQVVEEAGGDEGPSTRKYWRVGEVHTPELRSGTLERTGALQPDLPAVWPY